MNRFVHKFFLSLFFVMLLLLQQLTYPQSVMASPGGKDSFSPVTIILVDGLSVARFNSWMASSEPFQRWVERSYLGVMTMRTSSGRSLQNQLLTLSTGIKSEGPPSLLQTVQTDISAGLSIPDYRNWKQRSENANKPSLGEELKKRGISVAVLGNSDSGTSMRRLSPLLVADAEGRVPFAFLDSARLFRMMSDDLARVTDYERIKRALEQTKADLTVVELGDLRREPKSTTADQKIMEMILWIDQAFGGQREIWLLSPSVGRSADKRMEWMTPIVRHPSGEGEGGILLSSTTRQKGIIANVDFYPTMLSHWGLPIPIGIEGRALGSLEGSTEQVELLKETRKIFHIHQTRPQLLYQVITIQIILLLSILVLSYFISPRQKWAVHLGHYALIYVLMIPLFLLLLGGFSPLWKVWQVHLYLFAGGLLTGYLLRNQSRFFIYTTISLLYVLLLLFDGMLDNEMMKRSYLGYDPVIGARYYGIGNEYMGVLVGSALLLAYLAFGKMDREDLLQKNFRVIGLYAFLLLILLYLGLPNGGTNAGGTIAWLVAILVVSYSFYPRAWQGKGTFLIGGMILALFILFLLIQFLQSSGEATHVGRLLHQLLEDGPAVLPEMIKRKWEMNMRLIQVSTWSKLFVTSLLVIALLLLRTRKKLRRNKADQSVWSKAFRAIVWVSLVNLVVNDSGVVAAAIGLLFAVVPLLHMVLIERFRTSQAP